MNSASIADLCAVREEVVNWSHKPGQLTPWQGFPSIARRVAYVVMDETFDGRSGSVNEDCTGVAITASMALAGVPARNFRTEIEVQLDGGPLVVTLRDTDCFGEVIVHLSPADEIAEVFSISINRVLKGGVSYPSPRPEEQMITRIGRYPIRPFEVGWHTIAVEAVEDSVRLSVDGSPLVEFTDPDVAAGQVGIATGGEVRMRAFRQVEYLTIEEKTRRDEFVQRMTEFSRGLDSEYASDIAAANSVSVDGGVMTWTYPETGAMLRVEAAPGRLDGRAFAGLYGNTQLLDGIFAHPEVCCGEDVYRIAPDQTPALQVEPTRFTINIPLVSESGSRAGFVLSAAFTENATWFCTGEVWGVEPDSVALGFGLAAGFRPNFAAMGEAGEPAKLAYGTSQLAGEGTGAVAAADSSRAGFGMPAADGSGLQRSFLFTDGRCGHCWMALSGHDTSMEPLSSPDGPLLVLRSNRRRFRWALMWMPYHRLRLTGYRKRMVHFIRQAEEPVQNYRERPAGGVYPTDAELERYAAGGVRAMVWHHPCIGNNFRRRDGFVVNEKEMHRAMRKARELGIDVLPYIGIVPGRHPALRYEDLAARMLYDKNWDLQDFTFYSVAGRFADFFPYYTDILCRDYGIGGYYTDGGLALLEWGRTGLSEEQTGMSLEEMNDRLYSRIKRVLRRRGAGFGLENWGGAGIHLAGPFYECRMIGEAFQETSPESYRDRYNPLLTGTPFKMYGMDLVARNRYNIAMAAVCMTDIQLCSGNYSWGNWPDEPSDWANLLPFWSVLDSIDWDNLVEAYPWWAQELVEGDGFFAGYYAVPERVVLFLANRSEKKTNIGARIRTERLPEAVRAGKVRPIYPEPGESSPLGDGTMEVRLPRLHDGPLGWEITPG